MLLLLSLYIALVKCSVILASTNNDDSTNGSVFCVIIRNRMNKRLKYNQTLHVSENIGTNVQKTCMLNV